MPAGIICSDDARPGITRRMVRGGWACHDAAGDRIVDRDEIDRLNAIGLPPAYADAWFNPRANGHIRAIGWDDKGREQYRHHVGGRAAQDAAGYGRGADFGHGLPKIRKRIAADLGRRSLTRDHAVAAVVRLLDIGHLRVGSEAYARANESFGATTLLKRHGEAKGTTLRLRYKGKSGKERDVRITDHTLASTVGKMQDPGEQHLFVRVDSDGAAHPEAMFTPRSSRL